MNKLMLIKGEKEIILRCNTELEANREIRKDPKYTDLGDLRNQQEYKILCIATYITEVTLEVIEGKPTTTRGKRLLDVSWDFMMAGNSVEIGYNKCELSITLSDGYQKKIRVDATRNSDLEDLKRQISPYLSRVWIDGPLTEEGYIY